MPDGMMDTSASAEPLDGAIDVRAARAERWLPREDQEICVYTDHHFTQQLGRLRDISRTGMGFVSDCSTALRPGTDLRGLFLVATSQRVEFGGGRVTRVLERSGAEASDTTVGLRFEADASKLVDLLRDALRPAPYVSNELKADALNGVEASLDASDYTLDMFYNRPSPDVMAKCASFRPWVEDMQLKSLYQRLWRVTHTGSLDHRITVFDPVQRSERSMLCFDSNSYLGLHQDPRVIERVVQVVRQVGCGTPSAQMLCGTNRYLRELEEDLSDFLGREDTIIFPTGFAANIGTIGALVRKNDAVVRDRFSHASIHEGCRSSASRFSRVFAHNDKDSLETQLRHAQKAGCDGKLVVTDGVFSMHGRIAPLPDLVAAARRHSARLMVDDAHGVGVLGRTGRGIEEHWEMPGTVDVLMGTLSKALGAVGGFVSGSKDLIYYLRFFAASGMFTTSLPAAVCAGLLETLRLIRSEPEHRERLWSNIRYFMPALRDAGFLVPDPVSPIGTVFMGTHTLMLEFSRELFDAGIKCGNVMYPAVAKGESILRMTLNARHTMQELQFTVDALERLGRRWGILHRSPEEIREIGARVRLRRGDDPRGVAVS